MKTDTNKKGAVIENDGKVTVLIPLAKGRFGFDIRRTCVPRRRGMTEEQFREWYSVMSEPEELKEQMFDKLGIKEKELRAVMRRAHSESPKCQNLRQLVQACRKVRKAGRN